MKIKTKNQSFFNDEKELAKFLLKDVTKSLEQAIKFAVKITVKEEMEQIRKGIDEKISFNGYYQRNMLSPVGKIVTIQFFPKLPLNFRFKDIFRFLKKVFALKIYGLHHTHIHCLRHCSFF